jgi:hypothetical protein
MWLMISWAAKLLQTLTPEPQEQNPPPFAEFPAEFDLFYLCDIINANLMFFQGEFLYGPIIPPRRLAGENVSG